MHTIPVGDLIEHEASWECPCGPDGEQQPNGRWHYLHHSLDGREQHE